MYEEPKLIYADNSPIDVYGMPSANFADFDNDGDLDIICGEFLDKFTYFENVGNRKSPKYASGKLLTYLDKPITMDLEMIIPVAFDWDNDGDIDLVVGQEDGRVALVENIGKLVNNIPQFKLPIFFNQQADEIKFGALVTPYDIDWDNDGDDDLICGNTAGYIGFIENIDGGNPPTWAEPIYLKAENKITDEKIKRAIKNLPDNLRSVFVLYELQGMKYKEIGKSLEMPINSVKVYLMRARKQLQLNLKELKLQEVV